MQSRLARAGVVGAMALGAVAVVAGFGAPGGAQTDATTAIANPGFDHAPAVSHDGRIIVFASSAEADGAAPSLVLHDRGPSGADGSVSAPDTSPIPDSLGATNPSISGDGCVVTWSVAAIEASTEPEPGEPDTAGTQSSDAQSDRTETQDSSDGVAAQDGPVDSSDTDSGSTDSGDADPESPAEPTGSEAAALEAGPARLVVLDRCADPEGRRVDLALGDDDLAFGSAATSSDGSVLAVSNGTDVIEFRRAADGGYAEHDRFDGSDTEANDHLVGDRVDVSDDGSVIVFSGGLDLDDPSSMTVFARVTDEDDQAATAPVLASTSAPTVSGDGTLIVGSTGADASSVVVVDRTIAPLAPVDLGPGRRPAISADGNHVVFEEGANLAVVSRTGQGDAAFATTQRTLLSSTLTPTRSGPVIDRLGSVVISDREIDADAAPENADVSVTVVGADASFDAAMFDLGVGNIGAVLTSTVTFSNRGPASVGVAGVEVDGTFTIVENRCAAVLRAGTTCEIDVSFTVERLEDAFGVITLTPTSFGVDPYTAGVSALGAAPSTSSSSTTTTTTPNSSTGGSTGSTTGSTGGTSSGGSTTGRTSTSGSSTGGTRTTTTTTTTTLAPGAGVGASPAAFDFAPTIIDAGRRTGLVEIVNNGTASATVVGVRIEPVEAGPFQIVETTCAGESIAAGARCGVTLSFAPTDTGEQNVSLIASIDGGVEITVPVSGIGAPVPTVEVVPGVATVGQVVTLRGAGFPTGVTVDITWAATDIQVVVDDAGTFAVPVVVMSHTATGPATVTVAGQTDMFGRVTATMLVTETSDRSGPSVIDGVGPNIGR